MPGVQYHSTPEALADFSSSQALLGLPLYDRRIAQLGDLRALVEDHSREIAASVAAATIIAAGAPTINHTPAHADTLPQAGHYLATQLPAESARLLTTARTAHVTVTKDVEKQLNGLAAQASTNPLVAQKAASLLNASADVVQAVTHHQETKVQVIGIADSSSPALILEVPRAEATAVITELRADADITSVASSRAVIPEGNSPMAAKPSSSLEALRAQNDQAMEQILVSASSVATNAINNATASVSIEAKTPSPSANPALVTATPVASPSSQSLAISTPESNPSATVTQMQHDQAVAELAKVQAGNNNIRLVPSRILPIIEQIASGLSNPDITPAVLAADLDAESGFNADAVSPVGAEGIGQFMPSTWISEDQHVPGVTPDSPFNPAEAIPAQGHFLAGLANAITHALGASASPRTVVSLALASYNAGLGAVEKYGYQIPPYAQTQNYVSENLALENVYAKYIPLELIADAPIAPATISSPEQQPINNPGAVIGPNDPVMLSQYDPSVKNLPYGVGSNIADSGCAIVSSAEVISTLLSPVSVAQIDAYANTIHADQGEGTIWSKMVDILQYYGLHVEELPGRVNAASFAAIDQTLAEKGMVILAGTGSAPFTSAGHVLALRGKDALGNYLVADPNSNVATPGNPQNKFTADQLIQAGAAGKNFGAFLITTPSN